MFGKAGRAETSTDPAPFSMMETTVVLKPQAEWRHKQRWYSSWSPEWLSSLVFRSAWPDRISWEELLAVADRWEPDYATARRVTTPNFRGFIHLDVTL